MLDQAVFYASVFLLGVTLICGVILAALFAWQQDQDIKAARA